MMARSRVAVLAPIGLPILVVGLTLACLFTGYEPVGADPDLLYRPLKTELARSLADGTWPPLWSDHFGIGVPLAAESHIAAFYPPNGPLYRLLGVAPAYRLAMWLHMVATAAATYLYARSLGTSPWGSSLASVAFALCGFQAIHAGHEPFYSAMPYLPLSLLAGDRYAVTGRVGWMAALALAWGAQMTLGHFQIPFWTGGLVLLTGLSRIAAIGAPRGRIAGLMLALAWAVAIAGVQLVPTRELMQLANFTRSYDQLAAYSFPPSHWANPGFPALFAHHTGPDVNLHWGGLNTAPSEATFYVGTLPLLLTFVGLFARRDALTIWRWIVPAALTLATMPRWSTWGYWFVTCVPGLGWFRAPGRYTLIASLGLALLAGRGLDASITLKAGFRAGLIAALLYGAASLAWGFRLIEDSTFRSCLGEGTIPARFGAAVAAWGTATAAVLAWRRGWIGGWVPVVLVSLELATLYHLGPTHWGRHVPFPAESPIVQRLAEEPGVGLIAGHLDDLPVRAGLTPAFPYLGMSPPPPNYLLEPSGFPGPSIERGSALWMKRFGVTHGVWHESDRIPDSEVVFVSEDPALDRLELNRDGPRGAERWKIVRYPDPWPPAWVSPRSQIVPDWESLYREFRRTESRDTTWFLPEDAPPEPRTPRATAARVTDWDGTTAFVEHDGACDLVIRRPFYPGWTARVEGAGTHPIFKGDAGLQIVRLDRRGPSRVTFSYHPTGFAAAARVSLLATAVALVVAGWSMHARLEMQPEGALPSPLEGEGRRAAAG